jgi:hypothetical protein
MSGVVAPVQMVEFSEVLAWGLIVALVVLSLGYERIGRGGAVALAALAALATKAILLPLV